MNIKNNKRWIYIAMPVFFLWFFGQIEKLGISVIQTNPDFLSDLGITGDNAKIGFLTFIFFVAYAISSFFWGFFIDKFGARLTAIIGVTIWSLTMIMAGMSTTYEMFMITRIILGIGEGMMIPVCGKFIASWFNKNEVGRAQASWVSGNYAGPAVGAIFISLIIVSLSWQATFYILAGLNILIIIPMLIFLTRDKPEDHRGLREEELGYIREVGSLGKKESEKSFTQDFRYWIVWFGMMMAAFLFFGISIWLPTYLTQAKNFDTELMTGLTSLSWLFALGFVISCGYLADKTKRPSLIATILFISCAVLLAISIISPFAIVSGIGLGLAMGTMGGVFHLSNLFIVKYSTKETAGRAAGLMGFTNIFGGFASYVMGWIRDLSNGDFGPSLTLLIVLALFGFIAYLFTIKTELNEVRQLKLNNDDSSSIQAHTQ
ncbi:MFS transporter [Alteribacillus bidgolensis]|uniref:Sugar phosphate permease n=1 Tax=Alteribacillus bidgolensis TaxID=930129 RepID=A0A1G8FQX9_9BACI|nr:MFS transporter [Alteribacillus bidgolensis]SDH84540.1 Sugar phosphate permease [Alteribacillus bidgolensis]